MRSNNLVSYNYVRSTGIKMIDNNTNKRVSDIFNTKKEIFYQNSSANKNNKTRIIEVTEKMIDDKLFSVSPYVKGQKNENYIPKHLNSSIDFDNTPQLKQPINSKLNNSMNEKDVKVMTSILESSKKSIPKSSSQVRIPVKSPLLDFNVINYLI
jgi:hypothetical protein